MFFGLNVCLRASSTFSTRNVDRSYQCNSQLIQLIPVYVISEQLKQDHGFSVKFQCWYLNNYTLHSNAKNFARCLSFGRNEWKMRRMHFLIFHVLKEFASKSPIKLEGLSFCYPKNMEWYSLRDLIPFYWAQRKTTICVICANFHIELTAAESFVWCIFMIRFPS